MEGRFRFHSELLTEHEPIKMTSRIKIKNGGFLESGWRCAC